MTNQPNALRGLSVRRSFMSWVKELFSTEKPIIAMCHVRALPGDPYFDEEKGMDWVVERAREDFLALQEGGVDAVMFSNEFSLPYLTTFKPAKMCIRDRLGPHPQHGAGPSGGQRHLHQALRTGRA